MSVRALDHLTLQGAPGDPALVVGAETLSYAALEDAVAGLAGALLAQGLVAGDRVATWLPKTRAACLMPLAAARAGLVHVPINPALKAAQASHILRDSGAKLLVGSAARLASLDGEAGLLLLQEGELAGGIPLPPSDHAPETLAALLYTSGSTGRAKGVMLSHANLWLGAVSVADYAGLTRDDRVLGVLPLAFDYGQNQLLSAWAAGACVCPVDYLTARDVVKGVTKHRATTLAGVPPLWVQLLDADWPDEARASITRLTNSGGHLSVSVSTRLRTLFPAARLFAMYGLTEAFRSTYLHPDSFDAKPESIGQAIPHAEVLVLRPDGSQAAVGETGELVHAGPLVAQGYWQDATRTAVRFRDAPAASRYGGKAVWSGDLVRRDADGDLHFVGRGDAMIKTSGNRVSPTEVEEAAIASGAAREAVAFGVPDERLGQAIWLVVAGRPSEALGAHLAKQLPGFMQPARIIWRDEMPRGPTGKLNRERVRAEALA